MATNPPKNKEDVDGQQASACLYINVNMDGAPYLRKVDMKMYKNYEFSLALEEMFSGFTNVEDTKKLSKQQHPLVDAMMVSGQSHIRVKDLIFRGLWELMIASLIKKWKWFMKHHDKGTTTSSTPAVGSQKIRNSPNTEKPVQVTFLSIVPICKNQFLSIISPHGYWTGSGRVQSQREVLQFVVCVAFRRERSLILYNFKI